MSNMHNMSKIKNMTKHYNMLNMSNMRNMSKIQNLTNMCTICPKYRIWPNCIICNKWLFWYIKSSASLCVRGNCSRPIARTWCLSARPGYLMALSSSGSITYGSANFCSCWKSIQRQTLACSTTSASMFQCWNSTRAHGNQVIFCIFCIFWFVYRPQPGWISVNLQSSTKAVNKHKFGCDSSILHTGAPSSCSCGCYRYRRESANFPGAFLR